MTPKPNKSYLIVSKLVGLVHHFVRNRRITYSTLCVFIFVE